MVLEVSQALYERAAAAQKELAGLRRFEGTYTEDHLARLRAEAVQKANEVVEQSRREAAKGLEDRREKARVRFEEARKVDQQARATALAELQLIYGNAALRDDPGRLLEAYERALGGSDPSNRRVIEDLIEGVVATLPNEPSTATFKAQWEQLRRRNLHRLPVEEREPLEEIAEIDEAGAYLENAGRYAEDKLLGLTDPKHSVNLTGYAKTVRFEQEHAGRPLVDEVLPRVSRG